MKKTISFTTARQRIKYPGLNLAKEVKDWENNYKTLLKEIVEDTKK